MSDILTTFPTEAIPGRWRWHLNGRVDTVRCGTFAAVVKGDAVIGVVFVGEGAPRSVTDGTAFDPDSDHFERIDVPAESGTLTPEEAFAAIERGEWVQNGGYTWRNMGQGGNRYGEYWAAGTYPECVRTCEAITLAGVQYHAKVRPWHRLPPDPAEAPKVDPVEAAERVVGMKWRHADRRWDWIGEEGAELAIVWHGPPGDWDVYPFAGGASPVASGDGADHSAASLALLRAIDAGRVTLHDGAPGMGALTAAERAALGVG